MVSDQVPKISRRLRVKLFHAISKNLYGCAWDFRSFSQEGYNTIKFFQSKRQTLTSHWLLSSSGVIKAIFSSPSFLS